MDKDFRVKAYLYIVNEGVARGLHNHVLGVYDDAVDINPDSPYAEMRHLDLGDTWIVEYDLAYPPDKQDIAEGLFNHTKNTAINHSTLCPTGAECYVSIERCGHRIKQGCDPIERHEVV